MKRKKNDPLADPLSWRPVKAPSLVEMEIMATAAYEKLPEKFRDLCKGVIIHIDDFPSNEVWLYRRPILDYWAEHDETLGHIITHVLVHEIGHHFGLSDDDMESIEASVK